MVYFKLSKATQDSKTGKAGGINPKSGKKIIRIK